VAFEILFDAKRDSECKTTSEIRLPKMRCARRVEESRGREVRTRLDGHALALHAVRP
jgi:hypothetical protein